jgi:hypothetical protein
MARKAAMILMVRDMAEPFEMLPSEAIRAIGTHHSLSL